MNPNWGRWIFATMTGEFITQFTPLGVDLFIEGTNREAPTESSLFEFRMDGPSVLQPSDKNFVLSVDVNILIQHYMDKDTHRLRQWSGEVAQWLGQDHCIYRKGNGLEDDDTLLGTLLYQSRGRLEGTRVSHFGQIEENVRIEQASVEASFKMYL